MSMGTQAKPAGIVTGSLRALLSGVIDYAGLFPPASLTLDQSIRNYAKYRQCDDHWMLGRFICPAAKLAELVPYIRELFPKCDPLPVAMLGRGGSDRRELLAGLDQDMEALDDFQSEVGERASVDVFELRITQSMSIAYGRRFKTFVESPLESNWRDSIRSQIERLGEGFGFKLRTGGVEAKAFPSPEQVAFAIAACRDASVPIKFTAGLHHPIRHYNESVHTKMHGFINVFVAATFAQAKPDVTDKQLQAILEDEDPKGFAFDDAALRWRALAVTTAQVESARREFAISFGSCSFDEPREDLRALGWLS